MARPKIQLDHAGIAEILKSGPMHSVVSEATDAIAANVRSQGITVEGTPGTVALPVTADVVTTDRAHGIVALAHPSGMAVQAKDGALTKAAASAGLEVSSK